MNATDVILECYKAVKTPLDGISFFDNPKAGLFMQTRPEDEKLDECVVINSLPLTNDDLQLGNFNINVHVKDIEKSKPDLERIKTIWDTIDAIFPFQSTDLNTKIVVKTTSIMREDALGEHFLNARMRIIHNKE